MPERIKHLRKYLGLSQAAFAQKIGKTPGFISLIELGRSKFSNATLEKISEVFGVNINWILTGSGDMFLPGHEHSETDWIGVGDRIRHLRESLNLNMEDFASAIPCSRTHIYKVETGQTKPTEAFVRKVANAYLVSYDWLMTGGASNSSSASSAISYSQESEGEIGGTPDLSTQIDSIKAFLIRDSVAREVVLEAMKKDRSIWLKLYRDVIES